MMGEFDWAAFGGRMVQQLLGDLMFTGLFTFIGAPVLKYFARPLPWLAAASIFFWSMFVVLLVASFVDVAAEALHLSLGLVSALVLWLAALCAVGWLITRHLNTHYGMRGKFPATGAKVMATFALIATLVAWLIVRHPLF